MSDKTIEELKQRIRELEESLTDSRERYKQVTEQSPSVYELYDLQGLQVEVNRAYEELWDFPDGRSTTVGKFNVLNSQEVIDTGLIDFINRAYSGETVTLPPYEFNPRGETEAQGVGRNRWLSTKIYPLKDPEGNVTNIVITHEDISDRVCAEEENKRLQDQLFQSQKMEAIGHLVGGIAHDFNNILQGISNSAGLLMEKMKTGAIPHDTQEKWIEIILNLSKRGGDLTQSLLNFSGHGKFSPQVIDPCFVIKEVVNFLNVSFKPLGYNIKSNLCTCNSIYADATQLHQILQNIMINAKDSMEAGGVIEISSSCVSMESEYLGHFNTIPQGRYIKILIKDCGTGIEDEKLNYIFNPFYTTKEKGKGTGLGLAVTYKIIRKHGAYLDVITKPGKGTSFIIYFREADESKREQQTEKIDYRGTETILIVDDERAILDSLKTGLEQFGYRVLTASEGQEALGIIDDERPDIILSDLIMANGMGGKELFNIIKERNLDVPYYMMTGYYDETEVYNLKKRGINWLFHKPFSIYDFIKRIKTDSGIW